MAEHLAASRNPEKRVYWAALRAWRSGRYEPASRAFETLADRADLCGVLSRFYAADAHRRAGLQALGQRRYPQATQHLRTALKLNPQDTGLGRFVAAALPGQIDAPPPRSSQETEFGGVSQDARSALAMTLWQEGHQLAAISILRQGVRQEPHRVPWLCHLGLLLGARDEHPQAVAALRQALDLHPGHARARVHLALCLAALGQHSEAAEHLALAQCQRPDDTHIALQLALACAAAGVAPPTPLAVPAQPEPVEVEDLEALATLVSREPEVVQAFVSLPDGESGSDLLPQFAAALAQASARQPRRAELHYHLGRVQARLGQRQKAIESYERALNIDGRLVPALIALAQQYCRDERPHDAVVPLERVLQMGCEYADVYYLLGCLYRDQGDPERARRSYSQALHLNARYRAARKALESLAA